MIDCTDKFVVDKTICYACPADLLFVNANDFNLRCLLFSRCLDFDLTDRRQISRAKLYIVVVFVDANLQAFEAVLGVGLGF